MGGIPTNEKTTSLEELEKDECTECTTEVKETQDKPEEESNGD